MSRKNVFALAAALLMSSFVGVNAAGIGADLNVGPIGAHVGIGTPSADVMVAPAIAPAPMVLNQAAVVNGGITAVGPMVGGNLLGTTRLPAGTQIVTGVRDTAIVLPGMVGMPQLTGCNVAVVGNTEPSALSLIGTSNFVASLPVGGTSMTTRTFQRVATKHVIKRAHKKHHRVIKRQCSHRRVIRRHENILK